MKEFNKGHTNSINKNIIFILYGKLLIIRQLFIT